MLRAETKARARALQVLYAWELQGYPLMDAPPLARGVMDQRERIDQEIAAAAEHWRMERIGAVERNILRLGVHELLAAHTPAPVVIDEAVRLARWFAGAKAPAFVNGVLDATARRLGRL